MNYNVLFQCDIKFNIKKQIKQIYWGFKILLCVQRPSWLQIFIIIIIIIIIIKEPKQTEITVSNFKGSRTVMSYTFYWTTV